MTSPPPEAPAKGPPAPPSWPVFSDPGGRRWPRLRRGLWLLGAFSVAVLTLGVASVLSNPFLPRIHLPSLPGLPRHTEVRPGPPPKPPQPSPAKKAVEALRTVEKHARLRPARRPQVLPVAPPPPLLPPPPADDAGPPIVAGFYVNWDDASYASLKKNLTHLDWVIPEWARLEGDAGKRSASGPLAVAIDPRALDLVRREKPSARIVPLVQNYHQGIWDGALVASLLGNEKSRALLLAQLLDLVDKQSFAGLVIDFEEVPPTSQAALLSFLGELKAGLAQGGRVLGEAVPFDDEDWDYKAHAAVTDRLFLMAYDQHWSTSPPGPLAGQAWYEEKLAARLAELSPSKVIVCIGGYGYDWDHDVKEAEVISFADAMRAARDGGTKVVFDPQSKNPVVRYKDESGSDHELWFLDAATAWNEMRIANRRHVGGFALWRLGVEDPSLWDVLGQPRSELPSRIEFPYDVSFHGTGELLEAVSAPEAGLRDSTMEGDLVSGETYKALPSSYVIRRSGDRDGLVSLTFDDGPEPAYTGAILDILRRENVKASFFVIGEKGAESPELLRRIVAEGHDLGNHTYTHPNLGEASAKVTDLELNATQRLFESVTGRGTTLFRAPYFGDAEPQTPDEVAPIFRAQHLGYIAVGLRVDPDDWATPGTDAIVRRTLEKAGNTDEDDDTRGGHVVLLHDGGGDRSQTVAALPAIIAGLRAKGLRLVPVSELAGLTREQAMPSVAGSERVFGYSDSVLFYAFALFTWVLRWLFLIGLGLGLLRVVLIASLAVVQRVTSKRRGSLLPVAGPARRVSILVPAYNEEKVILRTIESLLSSSWPDFEVIVIDDGSKDRTYGVVVERFGDDPRVRAFSKQNGGKSEALAFGLERATGEFIVALDADTVFPPDVLCELVAPFSDPRVAAVAGNAKVGNRINLLTRWQALEYVASQNLDRRAFALLNCITVVPGAVGAWRRDVLEAVGGFYSDTLAEDQDLTLTVRERGYRIAYADRAIAWTEAPDTIAALAKQRFRWSFGTLQCMWKHRRSLLRSGTLGWVAMPNVWIFQVLFPLFAPIVDLLFVGALAWAALERVEHPAAGALSELEPVLFYYALFLVVDWLSSAVAFLLEREQWSLLFWFLLQRVVYRQVMYWVMLKSIGAALRGGVVGWGKLERKGSVAAARGA